MLKNIHRVWAMLLKGDLTSMTSTTQGTHATLHDAGINLYDEVVSRVSPRGTGGSLVHRVALVVVGEPIWKHEKLRIEVNCLVKPLGRTQSALDATQTRIQAL